MSLMIGKNAVVSINYTLTNDAGEVMDTSEGREPLTYLHGANNLIPGLEKEMEGKTSGQSFKVTIPPAEAYGESNPELIQTLSKDMFKGVDKVEPGMGFTAQGPQGEQHIVVTAVDGDQVTIDANHPMAGKTLHFAVEIVSVRDASAEEVEHGHVHDGSENH
ncbi:peptidylprolyl isomerase [Pseudohongiella acticola]|jgi:FKBP-type peptidyl-prolyl cis-trans isomerase SlyD|uniref:Peptidyl-prolyl cis-trans isomerase n=1 Tax=Pseudohongiella acticola TaxID=1524254 RepID=A0A1E8CK96_9GAMM|nr:peptidylprolyl isomerase [Pseudohongiella acticola]OFE12828.1 peptidylprolyl isomerase [Pseudohongiella acticola]